LSGTNAGYGPAFSKSSMIGGIESGCRFGSARRKIA
jgi:hypothetical protein